jgi:hypothetical protein
MDTVEVACQVTNKQSLLDMWYNFADERLSILQHYMQLEHFQGLDI